MSSAVREVRKIDLITYAVLPPIFIVLIWTLGLKFLNLLAFKHWIAYVLFAIATYFLTKRLVIGAVLVYKAVAPLEVRDKCRFEPTCSTYMIMAIKKYGLIIGIVKGINRLCRCKPPNGGVDYP